MAFLVGTWDGRRVPTALLEFDQAPRFGFDLTAIGTQERHELLLASPRAAHLVLVARGFAPAVVPSGSLCGGEVLVPLTAVAPLHVCVVGASAELRERADLFAQLRGPHAMDPQDPVDAAAYGLRIGFPQQLLTDCTDLPRAHGGPGRVVVYAKAKRSGRNLGLVATDFPAGRDLVEVDAISLGGGAIGQLDLTLEFSEAYPGGDLELVVDDALGARLLVQRFRRLASVSRVDMTLSDLPFGALALRLVDTGNLSVAQMPLPPVVLSQALQTETRQVVAASALALDLAASTPATSLRIVVRNEQGTILHVACPPGAGPRWQHSIGGLPAGLYILQALAEAAEPPGKALASHPVAVSVGERQTAVAALDLLPSGEVVVEGDAVVPWLELRSLADGNRRRHNLPAEGLRRIECPTGDYQVTWAQGSATVTVRAGERSSITVQ